MMTPPTTEPSQPESLGDRAAVLDPALAWVVLEWAHVPGRGAYASEAQRTALLLTASEAHLRWWEAAPFRRLRLQLHVHDPRWDDHPRRSGARKVGEDLRYLLTLELDELPGRSEVEALQERARRDIHEALVELARRRRLPPPPPLPTDLHLNRRERHAAAWAREREAQETAALDA